MILMMTRKVKGEERKFRGQWKDIMKINMKKSTLIGVLVGYEVSNINKNKKENKI